MKRRMDWHHIGAGVGHPDPDTPSFVDTTHGCDGCCRLPGVIA